MTRLARWLRRLRSGPPVIIVSGLPRSGTSMMMQMLAAGGVEIVTDNARAADEGNPEGYFELEAVKHLEHDPRPAWLARARGRAVKVVSPLVRFLPRGCSYQVIFMERDLSEVIASQDAMLAARGVATDRLAPGELRAMYESHLREIRPLLASRPGFETLTVSYHAVLADPRGEAARVTRFLRRPLDEARMAAAVNADLYRNRERAR